MGFFDPQKIVEIELPPEVRTLSFEAFVTVFAGDVSKLAKLRSRVRAAVKKHDVDGILTKALNSEGIE